MDQLQLVKVLQKTGTVVTWFGAFCLELVQVVDSSPGDLNAGQTISPSACPGGTVTFDLTIFDIINANTPGRPER